MLELQSADVDSALVKRHLFIRKTDCSPAPHPPSSTHPNCEPQLAASQSTQLMTNIVLI